MVESVVKFAQFSVVQSVVLIETWIMGDFWDTVRRSFAVCFTL